MYNKHEQKVIYDRKVVVTEEVIFILHCNLLNTKIDRYIFEVLCQFISSVEIAFHQVMVRILRNHVKANTVSFKVKGICVVQYDKRCEKISEYVITVHFVERTSSGQALVKLNAC